MRNGFNLGLAAALGTAASFVVVLLAVQVDYTGSGAPFKALADREVLGAIGLSFGVATTSALLAAFFAVPAGYALSRWHFRGKTLLEGLLAIPVLMSPMALGVSLLLVFRTTPGQWIEDHVLRFVFEIPGRGRAAEGLYRGTHDHQQTCADDERQHHQYGAHLSPPKAPKHVFEDHWLADASGPGGWLSDTAIAPSGGSAPSPSRSLPS